MFLPEKHLLYLSNPQHVLSWSVPTTNLWHCCVFVGICASLNIVDFCIASPTQLDVVFDLAIDWFILGLIILT